MVYNVYTQYATQEGRYAQAAGYGDGGALRLAEREGQGIGQEHKPGDKGTPGRGGGGAIPVGYGRPLLGHSRDGKRR